MNTGPDGQSQHRRGRYRDPASMPRTGRPTSRRCRHSRTPCVVDGDSWRSPRREFAIGLSRIREMIAANPRIMCCDLQRSTRRPGWIRTAGSGAARHRRSSARSGIAAGHKGRRRRRSPRGPTAHPDVESPLSHEGNSIATVGERAPGLQIDVSFHLVSTSSSHDVADASLANAT
jgi:hypothetical protein